MRSTECSYSRDLIRSFFSAGLMLILMASSCSLKSANDDSSIYVDLSELRSQPTRFSLLSSGGGFFGLTAPPAAASAFNCYAVNVTGPGIGNSSPNGSSGDLGLRFNKLLNTESYCSYRGVASSPIYLDSNSSAEVSLQVPPGGVRLVQLVGVNDSSICASGVIDTPPGSGSENSGGRLFEVGRAVLNDVFGDRSVNVAMNWPTGATNTAIAARAARTMDCGNGCGPIFSVGSLVGADEFPVTASVKKFAFKIPTVVGKRIHSIVVSLRAYVDIPNDSMAVLLDLYSVAAGSGVSSAYSTGYSKTVTITDAATASNVDFDLYGGSGDYPLMQSGLDYWVVLSSGDLVPSGNYKHLKIVHNPDPTSNLNSDFQFYDGSTWSSQSSLGVVNQVIGCSE